MAYNFIKSLTNPGEYCAVDMSRNVCDGFKILLTPPPPPPPFDDDEDDDDGVCGCCCCCDNDID